MQDEIQGLGREERQKLLKGAHFTVEVPTLESLAMKADLDLSWNKLRSIRR